MAFYATIDDLIESSKGKDLSYKNLHSYIYIKEHEGDIIKVPYGSVIRNYLPYLRDIAYEVTLTRNEYTRYRFKPKTVSYDLYNTTELWGAILELNQVYSVIDFNLENKKIKVFNPDELFTMLNEIMIIEGIIK